MDVVDEILLVHRMGTGKTCTLAAVTEFAKRYYNQKIYSEKSLDTRRIDPYTTPSITGALVVVSGEPMIKEFKFQLACKCTDREYETKTVMTAKSSEVLKRNVTNAINKFYSITTYGVLASELEGMTDDQIDEKYSGMIISVDEIHNVRNSGVPGESKKYTQLHRLFHVAKRRKILLLSATPMVDDVSELADVMNLILPLDKQMSKKDVPSMNLKDLAPFLSGRISYIRDINKGVVKNIIGRPLIYDSVEYKKIISPDLMIGRQLETYKILTSSGNKGEFGQNLVYASNFVYPDGGFTNESFSKFVEKNRGPEDFSFRSDDIKESMRQNLRHFSTKFDAIVQMAIKERHKKRYIFFRNVELGAIIFGLCLQLFGYERYNDPGDPFVEAGSSSIGGLKTYCSNPDDVETRPLRIAKKPRYAWITSHTTPALRESILKLASCQENVNGEYLQLIVGSPTSGEGLNLYDFLCFDNISPWWNETETMQAEGRIIRATGFNTMTKMLRKKIVDSGGNPDDLRIDLSIYNHCAVMESGNTIDEEMYATAERKNIEIMKKIRIIKQCAVDCQSHYPRNVREGDKDGSVECDYDSCKYSCISPIPKDNELKEMFSTLYAKKRIHYYVSLIRQFFAKNFIGSFQKILKETYAIPTYLLLALQKVVDEGIKITSKYGMTCYLKNSGDEYYLSSDRYFSEGGAFFASHLIIVDSLDLAESIPVNNEELAGIIREYDNKKDISLSAVQEILSGLQDPLKLYVFEKSISDSESPEGINTFEKRVLEIWGKYFIALDEPVEAIEITKNIRKNSHSKKIRVIEEDEILKEGRNGERIIVSILGEQLKYFNADAKGGMEARYEKQTEVAIRIFRPSTKEWKDIEFNEIPVYCLIVKDRIKKMINSMPNDIYGIITDKGLFKIADKREAPKKAASGQEDRRTKMRGRKASDFTVAELKIRVDAVLSYPVPGEGRAIEDDRNKVRLATSLKKEFISNALRDYMVKYKMVWYEGLTK